MRCRGAVAVWCGTFKTPVCRLKTPPCVHSKRPRVCGNTRRCFSTCVRGAGTHKDVWNVHTEPFLNLHTAGRRQFSLPKNHARRVLTWPQRGSPWKPLNLAYFQFENRSRTTRSRFLQSFASPDEAVKLQLSLGNLGGNQP